MDINDAINNACTLQEQTDKSKFCASELQRKVNSQHQTDRRDIKDAFLKLHEALNAKEQKILKEVDNKYKEKSNVISKCLGQCDIILNSIETGIKMGRDFLRSPSALQTDTLKESVLSTLATITALSSNTSLSSADCTPFHVTLQVEKDLILQLIQGITISYVEEGMLVSLL